MTGNSLILSKDIQLLKRLGIILLMLSISRCVFYFSNVDAFPSVSLLDFIYGIWMDIVTMGMYLLPFYILSLLPFNFYSKNWFKKLLKGLFHITNTILIALNLVDVEYFKFTAKRSTSDLFSMVTTGNDMNQLVTTFIMDFWWLIGLLIAMIIISNWLYNKTEHNITSTRNIYVDVLNFLIVPSLLFVAGRGGFGYRPVDMLTVSKLTDPDKTALVANTPLSIIKTIGKSPLVKVDFFPEGSENIYTPLHKGASQHQLREDLNIMVLVMESFGNEWLGKKSNQEYTPFLDSLLDQSLYFDNAFANGKKSIEAVPAIFAGIPSLMDNPYISSSYGTNSISALPQLLKEKGYTSAFYHGATNGSMKFDVFTAHLGFDHYFGRKEYNNEDHTDATWGVLDEYFMPWTAKSITKELKEPFLAGLFTLSSHHPYFVPEEHVNNLPTGRHPMAKSIAYADMSLKLFFEEAKKQPWYENTVFVICADHTPAGTTPRYNRRIGMYQIPIAFFDPSDQLKAKVDHRIFNQIDIMPSILDLTGYSKDVYAFGNSFFKTNQKEAFSLNYIANSYLLFEDDYILNFVENKATALYNYKSDTLMKYDSLSFYPEINKSMTKRLKGVIQRYNHDLINNTMKLK